MYVIKNYVLLSFCLQRIQPYVFMYGIKKYVFMSFCLQNMALKNVSLCHSVFKIWH